jgi:hypothetical protein
VVRKCCAELPTPIAGLTLSVTRPLNLIARLSASLGVLYTDPGHHRFQPGSQVRSVEFNPELDSGSVKDILLSRCLSVRSDLDSLRKGNLYP